jgi:hypothetical protein
VAIFPPDELEKFVSKNLDERIDEYLRKTILGKERPLSTYFTTTSSTSASTSTWTGSGLTYYYTTYSTPTFKAKVKEPDYIPSDEPSGRKRLEQEFKFDPAFLDMEGE